ncbi:MAG: mechanosensitive ion channel family protein [Bacteroidota bacterium]
MINDPNPVSRFDKIKSELTDKIDNWVDSVILNLPNFILAIISFIIFLVIAKYLGQALDKIIKKTKAQDSIRVVSVKVFRVIIVLIGFFLALGILNLDKVLTSILGAAGVLGLAIGLALQGTLNNTFSGVILSFLPKIQIGDWIETNDHSGRIIDINLRSVVLQTVDQNILVIPNSKIVDTPFKNYSRSSRGRVILTCGVGYESDLERVEEITIKAVESVFEQQPGENIQFYYQEFGDSSINYVVRFWSKVRDKKDVLYAQHKAIKAIKKAYNENDINIPFPIRTLDFDKNKFRSETLTIKNE